MKNISLKDIKRYKKAIYKNEISFVKEFEYERGFDPSYKENWAIIEASSLGHFEIVHLLLNHEDIDITKAHKNIFRSAITHQNITLIKNLLKDERFTPFCNKNFILKTAIKINNIEILNLLLNDPRTDVTLNNFNAVYWCSKIDHQKVKGKIEPSLLKESHAKIYLSEIMHEKLINF